MADANATLNALREAVRLAPDNGALRLHYAETLLGFGKPAEAEAEYRLILAGAPKNAVAKLGLARAYFQQNKNNHAFVVVEELIRGDQPPPAVYLLHARLLLGEGEEQRATHQYRTAVDLDPTLADTALAERLRLVGQTDGSREADAGAEVTFDGRQRMRQEAAPGRPDVEVESPTANFGDVGGMEALKDEIRLKIIHPLTHPQIYQAYGKKIGGGILMYGPPGCGKTHLARATAGEIRAGFIAVGIHDVLDMWVGNSEHRLHEFFEQARANRPCVLFFDEADALGASRGDMRHSASRLLINQFLMELDGLQASNEGVLILAATNAPWHLDAAFRRPGRFDRVLFVPPPDIAARAEILRILVRGKPVQDLDFDVLAKKTEGYSGADLRALVDASIEAKLREAMSCGVPSPLSTKDLQNATKVLRPTTREWFSTARNYALYSNQGGLYDDILIYLKLK